jgi:nickel superoxide dismutase
MKWLIGLLLSVCVYGQLSAHCQMPCGIYHDEMVFDLIDQFVETTVKAISVLQDNKFATVQERNTFVRWVVQKDKEADEVANLIMTYFLQQKIKPGEEKTIKRVLSAHQLLVYLVQIKQTVDLKAVNDFYEEWERFKLMFPIEGYKSKVNQDKLKKWAEQRKESKEREEGHSHDHDHSHD